MNKTRVTETGGMTKTGKTKVLSKNPVTVPMCPPQIPHEPLWDTTQVVVKGWQPEPWHDQINFNCNNIHFGYLKILSFSLLGK